MENLGIDVKLLIAQIINFILFFLIIKKFIAKPFLGFLSQEKKKDQEKEELIKKMAKQEEDYKNKEKELQSRIKKEISLVLTQAKQDAQKIKIEMLDAAKIEAEAVKASAHREMEKEKEALYHQVKSKVSELSLMIVNKALTDSLDEDSRRKVSSEILNNLEKKVNLYEN